MPNNSYKLGLLTGIVKLSSGPAVATHDVMPRGRHIPKDNSKYGPMTSHPDDRPNSAFNYLKPYKGTTTFELPDQRSVISFSRDKVTHPQTHTVNARNFLESYYGNNLDSEILKSQQYANKKNLPWANPAFNQTELDRQPSHIPPYGSEFPVINIGDPVYIPDKGLISIPEKDTTSKVYPGDMDLDGRYPGVYSATTKGVLGHELTHGLFPLYRHQIPYEGLKWHERSGLNSTSADSLGTTYPEEIPAELTPPAAAIQRYLFQTTGRRLESPKEYDAWIQQVTQPGVDRSTLPVEVQRWLNYRDTVKADQDEARRKQRMQYHDGNMRHMIPGVVRNRQRSNQRTV